MKETEFEKQMRYAERLAKTLRQDRDKKLFELLTEDSLNINKDN